jgi:hypothetical protein
MPFFCRRIPRLVPENSNRQVAMAARTGGLDVEATLKLAMAPQLVPLLRRETELASAKNDWIYQRGAGNILDDVWNASGDKTCAGLWDQVNMLFRVFCFIPRRSLENGMKLAGWRCPYEIEPVKRERERVRLPERKRVVRLRLNVHADYLSVRERLMKPHRRAACLAKQVQYSHIL